MIPAMRLVINQLTNRPVVLAFSSIYFDSSHPLRYAVSSSYPRTRAHVVVDMSNLDSCDSALIHAPVPS
jgi:hypothetical protein